MTKRASWVVRLLDAISQFFNVLIFNGDPNYSISGDAYRFRRKKLEKVIDWLLSPLESNHCLKAHLNDVAKARDLLNEVTVQ